MLKFQLLTAQDRKEAAAIEKRRQYEEERKKRIFNARTRVIGMDYETLNRQVHEKRQQMEEERITKERFAQQQIRDSQIALAMERNQAEEKRKIEKEINEYRKLYQRPQDRREFDINDPELIKKSLPARCKDDDPRLGISSAQKFEGEDLHNPTRMKEQKEQIKSFLEQQIIERNAAEKQYKKAEQQYQEAVIARDHRALELQKIEEECRKRLNEANKNFNLAMQDEKYEQKKTRQVQEVQANYAEMYNAITGDFLTENPDCAKSNMGPNRAIGFKYKGMTDEQRLAIRQDQLRQAEEKKIQRENEARVQKYWEDYSHQTNKHLQTLDREKRQKQFELNQQLAEKNRQLAKEQKQKKVYMDKVVYTNKPTADYYNSFNTSTR